MAQKLSIRAGVCLAGLCFACGLLWVAGPMSEARAADAARVQHELLNPQGEVEVLRKGSNAWAPAKTNLTLFPGDAVRTGKESRAAVRLSNSSVLRLDQLTVMRLPEPASPRKRFVVNLLKGAIYFFHRERPVETDFETPLVSGAIRGTEFNLAVAENGRTVLTLLDGAVDLSNAQGQIALRTGDQAVVEPGAAPAKTAVIEAANVIQWCLYYPAVLDVDELPLADSERQALSDSIAAYRSGSLPLALASYPANRQPGSASEKIYLAQLHLSVGQVPQTEQLLSTLPQGNSPTRELADALRTLIAAVTSPHAPRFPLPASPALHASQLLAQSYLAQSQSHLPEALAFARDAVRLSRNFGFAWARVAELEFSFGHTTEALAATEQALRLAPRNAQALVVKGFLLAARNRFPAALAQFDQAIALDSALANGWLGRGLCRIHQGNYDAGRDDLLVAAALEPNRSLLRSYLGKAFSQVGEDAKAARELDLGKRLDPNDPTPWLYSALLNQERNRINEAIDDLQRSLDLNENRQVYRSRLLLDEDRAVRGANLATIYQDAGLTDPAFREAARSANIDYANFSSHLFLANSYNELRDPRQVNLRYETPWLSEFLLANLLAPPQAGALSQAVSQQEYSRLFERNQFGAVGGGTMYSNGDHENNFSQYGVYNDFAYAADAFYRTLNGWRPNNDIDQLTLSFQFKYQLAPSDSVYLQTVYYWDHAGDLRQYFDQHSAIVGLRSKETQEPLVIGGWHHEWSPQSHTLLIAGHLQDTFSLTNPVQGVINRQRSAGGAILNVDELVLPLRYRNELEIETVELQHIWQHDRYKLIAGGRFQTGDFETRNEMPDFLFIPRTATNLTSDFERLAGYAYGHWQPVEPLLLIGGVSYDWLKYPDNFRAPPISGGESHAYRLSPKAGAIWTPWRDTTFRAAYTRSLGGVSFDQSFQLEPSQIAGFNQTFRSLIPESVSGALSAQRYETYGVAWDQRFPTRTFFGVSGETLKSHSTQTIGTYDFVFPNTATPSSTQERLKFKEESLRVTVNQLVGTELSFGAQYRLTHADLSDTFLDVPSGASTSGGFVPAQRLQAILHQVSLFGLYAHPSGVFAQAQGIWTSQCNYGYSPAEPGDSFWHCNVVVGYRFFRRRMELSGGILNITDRDYRLNPLTLYSESPRERTGFVSFKFYF